MNKMQKEKIWDFHFQKNEEFQNFFFSYYPSKRDLSFHQIHLLHNSQKLLFNLLYQLILLNLILQESFKIYKYNWMKSDIYIRKTDKNIIHLFIMDEKNQWIIGCKYGYQIYCTNFNDCFFENEKRDYQFDINCIKKIFDPYLEIFSDISIIAFQNLCTYMSKKNDPFFDLHNHEWNFYLYPLISKKKRNNDDIKIISLLELEKEIIKTHSLFMIEMKKIAEQFRYENHFIMLLKDWIEILNYYKKEFYSSPETIINMLRKIFYQYLIDHQLQHIILKKCDFQKMIVSLYLWCKWYEIYLMNINIFDYFYKKQELTILLSCLTLFFDEDEKDIEIEYINVYDIYNKKYYKRQCTSKLSEEIMDVHPFLRANYIYNKLDDFPIVINRD